ncbi:MAG: HNH endonuclease [Chloroflexota bacterium]|jgi:5-methylcytosine-specific restriction endonuclease McrA|nr:HNH endonuclease [Chloroflexota bacterium]
MVYQGEKELQIGNGGSANGVAEAVDVDVLIRAPVLVLNLNYVPVNVCTVRRAIVLLTKGKAELLENHAGQLHTVSRFIDAPSVIRLSYMVKRPFLPRKLSKKEVFLRDKFTCQYCGKRVHDLTLDHVIPRRQHGAHTWENVVTACNRCNLYKAGRTPAEAKMRLGTIPRAPDPNPYLILQNRIILEEWEIYIPWSIRD